MEQRCIKRLLVRLHAAVVPAVERKPFLRRTVGETGGIEFGLQIRTAQTGLQAGWKMRVVLRGDGGKFGEGVLKLHGAT